MLNFSTSRLFAPCIAAIALLTGCRAMNGAEGRSPEEQRITIRSEEKRTLDQLYAARPETKSKIKKAAGYAFFGNMNVNFLLLSTESGDGIVHNNARNEHTYMKMAGAGAGLGMGVKDYRVIFIFTDAGVMKQFVESGWDFGGQADAAAKVDDKGAAISGAAGTSSIQGMEIYQFTEKGLALQAAVQGTRYWRNDSLNK